jgi:uncharacterized protein (TIGR00266 family)
VDHEIRHRPSSALLDVRLEPGEALTAEAGAMVGHDQGVTMETNRGGGGILDSVKNSLLGGESFFRNTFRAPDGGSVTLAPPLPGDIVHHELGGETLYVQSGGYVAADAGIELGTDFGGARSFLGGEGLFLLSLEGSGPAFFGSYGAVEPTELSAGETRVVDTGHVVAFTDGVDWDVRRVGGLKSSLLSGEGLVSEFTGPGTVWIQTRSQDAFLSWLVPKLPNRNGGN